MCRIASDCISVGIIASRILRQVVSHAHDVDVILAVNGQKHNYSEYLNSSGGANCPGGPILGPFSPFFPFFLSFFLVL